MAIRYGTHDNELRNNNQIAPLGNRGQLSVVTETWNFATAIAHTTSDSFESDNLIVDAGAIFAIFYTSSADIQLTLQWRDMGANGSWGSWGNVQADGSAIRTERTVARNNNLLTFLQGVDRPRQFRLVPGANFAAAALNLKLGVVYINI